jgi:hypothetical protein
VTRDPAAAVGDQRLRLEESAMADPRTVAGRHEVAEGAQRESGAADDMPRKRVRPLRHFQLMITLQCPFACAHCCWGCHPGRGGLMPVADAVDYIEQARRLEPPPENINFTGGEALLHHDHVLRILAAAAARGLPRHYRVETNAYWCDCERKGVEVFQGLQALGVQGVDLSADPFHLDFISFERLDAAVQAARAVFGPEGVSIASGRWYEECRLHYLTHGSLDSCPAARPADHDAAGFLMVGRAAHCLAPLRGRVALADLPRSCHGNGWTVDPADAGQISVMPAGEVVPAACAGISLGNARTHAIAALIAKPLCDCHPLLRSLILHGPLGIVDEGLAHGCHVQEEYASVCHLCWDLRRQLAPHFPDFLQPAQLYEDDARLARRARHLVSGTPRYESRLA